MHYVLFLMPFVTDIAKKILLGRRYDEPLLTYSRFVGHLVGLFFSDVSF